MREFIKHTMMFAGVGAASAGVAIAIVADTSKRNGRPPDRYHFGSPGIMPMWDEKKPDNSSNPGYFYPSPFGGVQGKSFPEKENNSVRNRM